MNINIVGEEGAFFRLCYNVCDREVRLKTGYRPLENDSRSPSVHGQHLTLLFYSFLHPQKPRCIFLSDLDALDSSGRTPLHNAILGRHVKIIQLLLESGADTSLLDRSQDAPLHSAVRSGDEKLIEVG